MQAITAILPLLAEQVPAHVAAWGIGKKNPKLGSFIHAAQGAGHSLDAILGYLRQQLKPAGAAANESKLAQRASSGSARPDELAALEQIKSSQLPQDLLQKGVSAGAGALAGLEVSKLRENQNDQPQANANAAKQITPIQEEQQEAPRPKQNMKDFGQILTALSPKLKKFIEDRLSKGMPLQSIYPLVQKSFLDEIQHIEGQTGMSFDKILESLYGQERQTERVMGLQQQQPNQGTAQLAQTMMQAAQLIKQIRGK